MRLRFHPAARREATEAAEYYEQQREELGFAFSQAVRDAAAFVRTFPRAGKPLKGSASDCRRWQVSGFPYALVYTELDGALLLLAVAHAKRHPTYWIGRLPE